MAESSRTVRVSGLPTDIDDERLKDKLFIHFLRGSKGGGEIDSVIIVKATPISALITFEDSRVAQRVIHHGRHVLEVDGKKYKLTATEHCQRIGPDQIILSLSATIDYSFLPGGITALKNICYNHPNVNLYIPKTEQCCTLSGTYTEIQAILAQLLERPGGSESAENQVSSGLTSNSAISLQTTQKQADDQRQKPNQQNEKQQQSPDESIPGSVREFTPKGQSLDDPRQTDNGTKALQTPSTPLEDSTLIVDADMFQYLQKRCQREYQKILHQCDVNVVDMTNEGLTTLFLHVGATARECGHAKEDLDVARKAILQLYQEIERKIRRAQLSKTILPSKGDEVKRALDSLSVSHPKLLLSEDDQNVYIIGSDRDVSEAKRFFLLDHSKDEDEASDLKFLSDTSGSLISANEEKVCLDHPGGFSDERIKEMLKWKEDESKAEGAIRCKLAPQFKDSGIGLFGTRLAGFTSRVNSYPSRPRGPMLGRDVLSDTAKFTGEPISRAEVQNTGEDILFNTGNALPSFASLPSKSSKPELMDARPKTSNCPLTTTEPNMLGSKTPFPASGSGTTLKRSNSFSGTSKKKLNGPLSQDDSRARVRSSSFSSKTSRDKQEVYTAELTVPSELWSHIIEAYRPRVDDLTSDILVKERILENGGLTLILKGATSSKVNSCQLGLQELIDRVQSDFSVQELRLSELGITDTTDETLQACCSEVRSRFKKVTIRLLNDSLFLQGPRELCSQIGASVREVFSGALDQSAAEYTSFVPSTSQSALPALQMDQSAYLQSSSTSAVMGDSKKVKTHGEWQTTYNTDFIKKDVVNSLPDLQLKRREHVTKDKGKAVEVDGQKIEGSVNHSAAGYNKTGANGVRTPTTSMEKVAIEGQEEVKTESLSRSGQEVLVLKCQCGADGISLQKTKCGLAMCSKCLDIIHINCTVCHKMEQKSQGIIGKMNVAKLPFSLPGHTKDCVIKITYEIPDGVQGDSHPLPGKPFRGGIFEAFFPDSQRTKALLPRLREAFRQGLTFTVTGGQTDARVAWDGIPHKTSSQGGRSGNGYPDSTFLKRLSEVLTSHGI